MFWLSRPSYLRWAVGAVVMVVGVVAEFRPPSTVPHPFAVTDIAVGAAVDRSEVVFRNVPAGLLEPVSLPIISDRPIGPGEPVLTPRISVTSGVPAGWWASGMDLPAGARAGMSVRLALDGRTVDGIIVEAGEGQFGEHTGLVAVPGADAADLGSAIRDGSVVVFVGG